MASIFVYNRSRGHYVELATPHITEEDIHTLKACLPRGVEGLAFAPPPSGSTQGVDHFLVENKDSRVAEYCKTIGKKLEAMQQVRGAVKFYDLAFRLNKNLEIMLMTATLLGQHGHVDQADRLVNLYLQKCPDSAEAFFVRGKLALSRSDYEEAKVAFQNAQKKIRLDKVDHIALYKQLSIYERFVGIYLDRDQLFTRDLPPDQCIAEIKRLSERTGELLKEISENPQKEQQGMQFFLENQQQIFKKWLVEMEPSHESLLA